MERAMENYLYRICVQLEVCLIVIIALAFLFLATIVLVLYYHKLTIRKKRCRDTKNLKVGLFHPYCSAGGGGERVLWVAVEALQKRYPEAEFYIYTGDVDLSAEEILNKVKNVMNIDIKKNIKFIYLTKRSWIEPAKYPYLTLLGQAIGSMFLALEALDQFAPDIMIDTMGLTFAMILFKYVGECRTGSYLHYPFITNDMMRRVARREARYNNSGRIARSLLLTSAKRFYYKCIALGYGIAGRLSDIILVNSTFTLEHLSPIWTPLHLVYPPCDVEYFKAIKKGGEKPKKIKILSLAQFRPEKDHALQLQALYELREIVGEDVFDKISLILIGSCRHSEDEALVKDLKDLSRHLSLEGNVQFKLNVSFEELRKELEEAYIGIHTMEDEHFGISVVEQMAAGLIVIAHRSGGPLLDIIETSEGSRLGFLAVDPLDYANSIKYIINADEEDINKIRDRARSSVDRFSTKKFQDEFLRAIEPLFKD